MGMFSGHGRDGVMVGLDDRNIELFELEGTVIGRDHDLRGLFQP